jgi:hypothetical protein
LDNNIPCESFESFSAFLHDGDGNVAGFALFDVPYGARFARVRTSNDRAVITVVHLCIFPHDSDSIL